MLKLKSWKNWFSESNWSWQQGQTSKNTAWLLQDWSNRLILIFITFFLLKIFVCISFVWLDKKHFVGTPGDITNQIWFFFFINLLTPCHHIKVSALSSSKQYQAVKSFSFKNIYKNLKIQISSVSAPVKKYTLKVNNCVHVKVNISDIFLV